MSIKNINNKFFEIFFISFFIFIYVLFIIYCYLLPNHYSISILLPIGFIVVIIGFFLFVNLNHNETENSKVQLSFLAEDLIKIILVVVLSVMILIPPILTPKTIVLWEKIKFINYIRAISILVCCIYLPGANLFNFFFQKSDLHKKFGVESFLLKITLYPLLSLAFIGLCVLFLDQIGLNRNFFVIVLFLLILGLFFFDITIKKFKKSRILINIECINISKYTFIILIVSIGVLLISLGIHLGINYLIPGDSWIGLASTNFIGSSDSSPIEWGKNNLYYPIFWSYIIFGLSVLGGLPYINMNALLAPLCYLYVTSTYLLMKAILYHFKEIYSTLATLLLTIFSGLFYISTNYSDGIVSSLIMSCQFYFIYKSYSYISFVFALSIFIIILKTANKNYTNKDSNFKNIDYKFLFLSAFFLIISYMLYLIPLLMGIVIIILICLFSDDIPKNLHFLSQYIFFIIIIFISLDLLMNIYLSSSIFFIFQWFFKIPLFSKITYIIPDFILIYSSLFCFFMFLIINQVLYSKILKRKKRKYLKFQFNPIILFKIFSIAFTIFLIMEIISISLEEFVLDFKMDEKITFFFYLDKIFLNIGFIGITSIYLSYFSFKKNKKLFYMLISWIIISFLIGSVLIFLFWFQNDFIKLNSINMGNRFLMNYWFKRIWFYSIFPLGALSSIGMIRFVSFMKKHQIFKQIFINKNKKKALKLTSLSLLILFSYTNLIFAGISSGDMNKRPKDEEIEIISWMSEHIPKNSKFLIENNYIIRIGIFSMVNGYYYYIHHRFKSDFNETENIEEIDNLINDKIEYLLVSKDFINENSNRSLFFKYYLIPYFYNDSEYETRNLRLYYAPYFN